MVICLGHKWLLKWLTNNAVDQREIESLDLKRDLDFAVKSTVSQSLMDMLLVYTESQRVSGDRSIHVRFVVHEVSPGCWVNLLWPPSEPQWALL